MGLHEALEQASTTRTGRGPRCRICHLLDTLPDGESAALAEFFNPARNLGPKPIADALAAEGYGDVYHSVKSHLYLHRARA